MARDIRKVGVVGLGTMGSGIVEVFARNGIDVVAVEIDQAALDRGRAHLTASTDRAVSRGKLAPADRDALVGRVRFAVGLDALRDVDLAIEAVPERLEIKRAIFAELDRVCPERAILASNTSSLSLTEIAVTTGRPDRVIGMHFFNPAPVMKLVEIIRTVITAPDVVEDITALCRRLGKTGVSVMDRAGFIGNWLLFGYLNQAVTMFADGYASREDLDAAMKLGAGLPMGPLALMDLIGVDVALEILDTMYRRGGRDRRHAPAPLIRQMVTAGLLGRKTGRGFYTYAKPGSGAVAPDGPAPQAAGSLDDLAPSIATVGVVGSGTLAAGAVEAFARAGYEVVSVPEGGGAAAPREAVAASMAAAVSGGQMTAAQRDQALARMTWAPSVDRLDDADLVVEAVAEDLDAKKALFAALDGICKPDALLATTTSRLPVIECAMATGRPDKVLGLHLSHPAPAAPLVEIVRTIRTAPATVDVARGVCATLGRTGVVCADRAGFIVNALLFPYLNDAVRMLESSYSTADGIDAAMKLGCGYPVGPFELLDTVGLDEALAIQRRLYAETREPGMAPAPLLEQLVTAGYLGRQAGRGFRDHTGG